MQVRNNHHFNLTLTKSPSRPKEVKIKISSIKWGVDNFLEHLENNQNIIERYTQKRLNKIPSLAKKIKIYLLFLNKAYGLRKIPEISFGRKLIKVEKRKTKITKKQRIFSTYNYKWRDYIIFSGDIAQFIDFIKVERGFN